MKKTHKLSLPEFRKVHGAITVDNAVDYILPGSIIYAVLIYSVAITIAPGTIVDLKIDETEDGEIEDVWMVLSVSGMPKNYSFYLSEFNGHSNLVGQEEPESNQSRIFYDQKHAVEYASMIKDVRDTQSEMVFGFLGKNGNP